MECCICRKDKASTKYYDTWVMDVCDECDKIMEEGYTECYLEKEISIEIISERK